MPSVSEKQHNAMEAAAHGNSTLGIPKSVGKEFVAKDGVPGIAAGIIFVAPDGDVLLLRRSATEVNFGGHWGLPGGKAEGRETAAEAATRETLEETGRKISLKGDGLKPIDMVLTPNGMVFTTFVLPVEEKFVPKLDGEHSGYCWASLDMLPMPLHPSVARTLGEHIGVAADMKPEEWDALRKGFAKWTREEEAEPEHAQDHGLAMDKLYDARGKRVIAHDILAMDLSPSVRHYDKDGQLHINRTPISKAMICEYYGREIPNNQALGLDPSKKYRLLRDPEELKKGAATSNGKQLMFTHVPVNADDPQKDVWVGSVGTDAEYEEPYLFNSLHVHDRMGIDGIETEEQKQISSSYRYRADMTPGAYQGEAYDGVMRDIDFNHVCLVTAGRCGDDVFVHDSKPKPEEFKMTNTVLSRKAAVLKGGVMAYLQPKLAMDAKGGTVKVDITPILKDITNSNFSSRRAQIVSGITACTAGKLAADAKLDDLPAFLGAFDETEAEEEKKDKDKADDEDPKEKFLKEKLSAEDKAAYDALGGAKDGDPDKDEDGAKAKEKDAADKAKDAKMGKDGKAKDADPDKKPDMVDKPAMDAAIAKSAKEVRAQVIKEQKAIREAEQAVQPWVGQLNMAFDSAPDVYKHALEAMEVDIEGVDPSAYPAMLKLVPQPGQRGQRTTSLAMDSAEDMSSFNKMFPDAGRIGHA